MIKNMNSKMTTNSQLVITEPKKKNPQLSKQLVTESQKWRSHEGLSVGDFEGGEGERYRE